MFGSVWELLTNKKSTNLFLNIVVLPSDYCSTGDIGKTSNHLSSCFHKFDYFESEKIIFVS